jgi:hypothetical protein
MSNDEFYNNDYEGAEEGEGGEEIEEFQFEDDDNEIAESDFDNIEISTVKVKTIIPDLKKYVSDENLILKADELYRQGKTGISRQKQRIYLLFAYTLMAYRILYGPVDPNKIGKLFSLPSGSLTPGKQNTAMSSFSNKKENNLYYTSPIDLIPEYCKDMGITDLTDDIISLAKQILQKEKSLMNVFPQTVAAGLIYYYLTGIYDNADIDKNRLKESVGRTLATIRKMAIIISEVDNQR